MLTLDSIQGLYLLIMADSFVGMLHDSVDIVFQIKLTVTFLSVSSMLAIVSVSAKPLCTVWVSTLSTDWNLENNMA